MICIPLSAKTNQEMIALARQASSEPADLYELRLDILEEPAMVEEIIAACDRPVMATCRSVNEGGGFRGGYARRRDILRRSIQAGVEYVDCEASDMESLRGFGPSKLVISMHDFSGTPSDLDYRISALTATKADWVKFAVTAHRPADNLRVFEAMTRCPKPVIGIAMGEMGLVSRVLGQRFGSRLTFASLDSGRESAPGQITARQLSGLYRYYHINHDTELYGVLTEPGDGGRDQVMAMNLAFRNTGRNAVCLPFAANNADDFLRTMPVALGIQGLRIAEPHRKAALEFADEATDRARRVGSASVLIRHDGYWLADNDRAARTGDCYSPFLRMRMTMATSA
ncbi:MAG: type I 3-dehydroquinate dehydratase [Planctomycetaceae bacterium]|nr:type I 3-dehydroquinate dehydratase [Planctomycetaceae bacterium]